MDIATISMKAMDRERFISILQTKELRFALDQAAQAREIQREQQNYWLLLFNTIIGSIRDESKARVEAVLNIFNASVMTTNVGKFDVDGEIVLRSEMAMILSTDIDAILDFAASDTWFAIAAVFLTIGADLIERVSRGDKTGAFVALAADPRFVRAVGQVNSYLNNDRALTSETIARTSELNRKVIVGIEEIAIAKNDVELQKVEFADQWKAFLADRTSDLEAAKKNVIEETVLRGAHQLWHDKARSHSRKFWIGLAAMVIATGIGVRWAAVNGKEFLKELSKNGDGDLGYPTLLLLIISIIAMGWCLRFLARFVHENMILQTDATHRRAMLQTYSALVASKDAKMEPTDRVLILTAVFRPLPGHQAEDVAPPSMLELAKNALPGK